MCACLRTLMTVCLAAVLLMPSESKGQILRPHVSSYRYPASGDAAEVDPETATYLGGAIRVQAETNEYAQHLYRFIINDKRFEEIENWKKEHLKIPPENPCGTTYRVREHRTGSADFVFLIVHGAVYDEGGMITRQSERIHVFRNEDGRLKHLLESHSYEASGQDAEGIVPGINQGGHVYEVYKIDSRTDRTRRLVFYRAMLPNRSDISFFLRRIVAEVPALAFEKSVYVVRLDGRLVRDLKQFCVVFPEGSLANAAKHTLNPGKKKIARETHKALKSHMDRDRFAEIRTKLGHLLSTDSRDVISRILRAYDDK